MKNDLLDFLMCPVCKGEDFLLVPETVNDIEVREGQVICSQCNNHFSIREGILDLLVNPTEEITKEQNGWTILEKAVENNDELMLSLPDALGDHKLAWQSQAENFHYMFDEMRLKGNEKVLDLGSGRCWTTRYIAQKGCYVVGIDILLTKYVGLLTSDVFINHDRVYFERVCGNMNQLPFRDYKFDIVFISASLHHSSDIKQTMKEVARVLVPGGKLLLVNEPTVGIFTSKQLDCPEIHCGINEHVYYLTEYLSCLRVSDFNHELYPYIGSYSRIVNGMNHQILLKFPQFVKHRIWTPLVYAQHLLGGGVLNMVAQKKLGNRAANRLST